MTKTTDRPAPAAGKARVDVAELKVNVAGLFQAAGLPETAARAMAQALVEAEQQGLGSHGLMHLPLYLDRLKAGSVSTADRAELVSDQGAVAVLDARHMLGHLAAEQAMALAVEKAKSFGIGAVAVRHGFHFGAAGRYVRQAAEANCIGIAMSNTKPMMPAPGGAEPLVGNNPLAIGIPSADQPAIVMDMATSEGALGKIRMAARAGQPIPPTWAVTADGEATTDPDAAIRGMLLPTGGPKGFALALMIDLMCGLLSGGASGAEVRPLYGDVAVPNDCSFLFIAMHAGQFGQGAALPQRAAAARGRLLASKRAAGAERVVAPGQRKWEAEQRQQDSVDIDETVLATLAKLG
ncbi:Ldh family oxidoreductase [Phreatobacter stygius]|uniref:Ldh family oxidoreductase n=1 Tax=Phreatobacter stygius TaxID=1940610 RepID=A0A4D7B340_9HYPH|nr:Ldh family oxidoreductase [Phreatobacter stygius]QCI68159.1 Ldh family oxidoreductase [Phreatobacter stygius]